MILYGNSNDCKSAFKQRLCQIPVSLPFVLSLGTLSQECFHSQAFKKRRSCRGQCACVFVCLLACIFLCGEYKMKKILCFFTCVCVQSLSCSACVSVCECARTLLLIRSRFHHWLLKTAAGSVHCSTLFTVYSHRLSFCPLSFALIADNLFQ